LELLPEKHNANLAAAAISCKFVETRIGVAATGFVDSYHLSTEKCMAGDLSVFAPLQSANIIKTPRKSKLIRLPGR
jgi:hypothetical protein